MFLYRLMPEGGPSGGERLDCDQLRIWLDKLPLADPVAAARVLAIQAKRVRKADLSPRKRLKMLELVRAKAELLLPEIEARLSEAPLPLPLPLQTTIVTANQMLKELSVSYNGVVTALGGRWYGVGAKKPLRLAVFQAIRLMARRLALAYRIYARGSRSAWLNLHGLYRIARRDGFAQMAFDDSGDTAEQIYVRALLLAFAEPAKLGCGEVDRLSAYLQRHAALARLESPSASQALYDHDSASFLVRPGEARPGRSLLKSPQDSFQPEDLILRCSALVERLSAQVRALEAQEVPAKLGLPKAAAQPQYVSMLKSALSLWAAPRTRRFPRNRFHPRVDVVVGFLGLWNFLTGAAHRRRAGDERPVTSAAQMALSEWSVTNESPDGFAFRYLAGNVAVVRVGDILGVRARDAANIQVCVVRRALADALNSLEVGAQVLGSRAQAAIIALPEESGATVTQRIARVVVIPKAPALRNAPVLIAQPDHFRPGMELALPNRGSPARVRIGPLIEKMATCELYVLEAAARAKS
jgi:hypothetical protein